MEYGTGAIMAVPAHDERDYAFARAFGLPIRRVIEGAPAETGDDDGLPYTGDGPLVSSHPDFDGMGNREALRRDRGVARPRRQGPRVGQLPPARLAGLQAALLGHADPDRLLRALRHGAGARRAAARASCPTSRTTRPEGRSPLAAAEDWVQTQLPGVRRSGAARDGHDGHVRGLLLVLPALLRRAQRPGGVGSGGAARVDARRSVHRRSRARDPAPHVRALLHQGARGPRPPRLPGAVQRAVHAGHGHQGRLRR